MPMKDPHAVALAALGFEIEIDPVVTIQQAPALTFPITFDKDEPAVAEFLALAPKVGSFLRMEVPGAKPIEFRIIAMNQEEDGLHLELEKI